LLIENLVFVCEVLQKWRNLLHAYSVLSAMHSKSSHHKKHKKDKKKHKHKSHRSDEGSRHHHKRKRKHTESADGETAATAAASDIIYLDDGAHSVKQLRLDDDNSLQVAYTAAVFYEGI